jgi:hypothetical protein
MNIVEYPKWVYPNGVLENYKPGSEPVLVGDALGELAVLGQAIEATPGAAPEATPEVTARRRGRPPKDAA